MKKYIIIAATLLMGVTSCYKAVLDPLQGKFPEATKVQASSCSATAEKVDALHFFTVDLKDGSNSLHLVLAAEKYYLTSNTYIEAQESAAKKGNFILGKTTVNGVNVKSGKIVVEQTSIDEITNAYVMSAVLFLEDGSPYTLSWSGNLDFYPDPVEGDIVVENALSVDVSVTEAGTVKYVVNVVDGDGAGVAFFELFTPVGVDGFAGSYTCIEYAENDPDGYVVSNGWNFPEWGVAGGSHYVVDGTQIDLQPGSVVRVAALSDTDYAFSINDEVLIVAGVPGNAIVVGGKATMESSVTEVGTGKVVLTLVDEEDAHQAFFELYTAPGATTFCGSFTCIEYAENNAEGNVVSNGWSFPEWGIAGGSHYVVNGVQVDLAVGVVVTVVGLGDNMISLATSDGFSAMAKLQ